MTDLLNNDDSPQEPNPSDVLAARYLRILAAVEGAIQKEPNLLRFLFPPDEEYKAIQSLFQENQSSQVDKTPDDHDIKS